LNPEEEIVLILAVTLLPSWVSALPFRVPGAVDTVGASTVSLLFKTQRLANKWGG